MNIGLVGTGSIGTFLLQKLNVDKLLPGYRIVSIFDSREKSTTTLQHLSSTYNVSTFNSLDAFLKSNLDLIVECAGVQAVGQYASQIVVEKEAFNYECWCIIRHNIIQ